MDRTYITENDRSRMRLKALVTDLRDEEFDCPVTPAPWTVGVALCHLAFWDRQWLAKFEEWERTGRVQVPQLGDAVHAINDSMVAWFRTIAPAQVRHEVIGGRGDGQQDCQPARAVHRGRHGSAAACAQSRHPSARTP